MSGDAFNHLFIEPASYDEARQFYCDKLGWQVEFEWGGDGEPRGSSITSGGMTVVLAERHSSDDRAWSHGVNGSRPTLHLMVADVESAIPNWNRPVRRCLRQRTRTGERGGLLPGTRTVT